MRGITDLRTINPFNPYYPAEDRFFANRRREVEWFRETLLPGLHPAGPGPVNVAVLGPWGIGKSSLVRKLHRIATQAEPPVGAVFLSCTAGVGSMSGFARSLIGAVREEILSLGGWSRSVREKLDRLSVEVHLPLLKVRPERVGENDVLNAADFVRSSLRRFWEQMLGPKGMPLLIILDDAHLLQGLDNQALMILRAVFQDLQMYRARYGLVLTGPPGLFGEVRDIAEPVTRFFEHMPLTGFNLADTAEAVRQPLDAAGFPLDVPDETVEWIWRRTEGHPYFVSFLMRDFADASRKQGWTELTPDRCELVWPSVLNHLEVDKFSVDWASATPAERDLLRTVAEGAEIAEKRRGLLTRLLRKNLVDRVERGRYRLYHPLFAEFVLHRGE